MDYLLKSTICLTAFYGLYFFGFRRLSFHTLNRFYLLASLALSLTIPLLSYERTELVMLESQPIEEATFPIESIQENTYSQVPIIQQSANVEESAKVNIDWMQVISTIYLVGVGAMLIMFVKNLLTIFYSIKSASVALVDSASLNHQRSKRKLKILLTKSQSNSSFFNYVFLNTDNLNPHEEALIIAHEGFHAQRLHTLDLLISSILKAVFWFNPIVYFYQKSLKQIHEYEVDALMSATYDGREYAHLLLKLGVAPSAMITNQFSTKPLSERIQFLFKTPTKNMKKLLYFLSLPIIAVGVMAFAEEKVITIYKQKSTDKAPQPIEVKNDISKTDTLKKANVALDTLTQNFASQNDSSRFCRPINFALNLEKVDSITIIAEGQILIKGKDFITKNNSILLDKKYENRKVSIRVHSSYNIGGPGSYYLYPNLTKLEENAYPIFNKIKTLPIFTASRESTIIPQLTSKLPKIPTPFSKVAKNQDTLRTILEANKLGKNPLVYINGEEYPSSILYRINPDAVVSMVIPRTNGEKLVDKYGEKAKDGIVRISTKKNVDFLLKNEKEYQIALENIKNLMLPTKGKVKRVLLKDFNGRITEKVSIIDTKTGLDKISMRTDVGKKAIFFIDNVLVSEDDVNNYNGDLFHDGYKNEIIEEKYPKEVKSADMIFNLKTKRN
ncbi:hypothetical protein GCM10011514_51750 [Emticicia aquatilis]|uniref:Peptidase M56 domain-containing protein n=1 Tax=Emticicia aquatilis TaxID=1537369 RepID=A0A916Z9C8_9BACT|nr:M56 family metallopeptidase [Emticicia aquatilis]GGD81315.1 hypothetical protein GCM10011514_51750 [Emticicia aquatilis]